VDVLDKLLNITLI